MKIRFLAYWVRIHYYEEYLEKNDFVYKILAPSERPFSRIGRILLQK